MSNIPSSKATRRLSLVIVLIVLSIYSFHIWRPLLC
jgi:hypothetical protein